MPIGQRTPGPIHLFCKFRFQSSAFYMGTCVTAPEPEHEKFKIPVMNDIGGRSVPFQLVQDGENALVIATMNRFDYGLIQSMRTLESVPPGTPLTNPLLGNSLVGSETAGARGTLNIGVSDWQLILFNEYAGTPSQGIFVSAPADLPLGRIYSSCNIRKYKESTVGTRVLEVALAVDCQNVYNNTNRTFSLYSELAAAVGNLQAQII